MTSLPLVMMLMLSREIYRVRHAIALNKVNAELVLARQACEEASKAKSVFLANMSDELRTPLNAILGFSKMIRDKLYGADVDRYASFANDIHQSGAHLLNVVNDVLDVSKIEAGKLELREEEVKLQAVIEESLLAVRQLAADGGVVEDDLAARMPAKDVAGAAKLDWMKCDASSTRVTWRPKSPPFNGRTAAF